MKEYKKSHIITAAWIGFAATILAALLISGMLPIDKAIAIFLSNSDAILFENALSVNADRVQVAKKNGENHHLRVVLTLKNISSNNIEVILSGAPPNAQDNNGETFSTADTEGVKHLVPICGHYNKQFDISFSKERCLGLVKSRKITMHLIKPGGQQPLELELMPINESYKPDPKWLNYLNFTIFMRSSDKVMSDVVSLEGLYVKSN